MSEHVREHRSLLAAARKAAAHPDRRPSAAVDPFGPPDGAGAGGDGAGRPRASGWRGGTANWLWVVVAALAVNWFGDSLDGTLARVRGVERPRYGFYVDHVLDIVGITFLLTGLACSGFMTPVIALSLLVAYLLVSGEVFLATAVHGVFRMSFAGVGPTELRILLSVGAIALRGDPHVNFGALGRAQLFDVGGVVAIAGLLVALGVGDRAEHRRAGAARAAPAAAPGSNARPDRRARLDLRVRAFAQSVHGSTIPLLRFRGNSPQWGCLTQPSRRRLEVRSSCAARGRTTSRTSTSRCPRAS